MDHRAVEDVLRRVADRGALDRRLQAREEVVVHALVDDHGAQRGAALARGAEAAEQRALDGEVEVGVGHDHERVLAAELQARRLQVAPAQRADLGAHRARAGEADLVDQAAIERLLEAGEGLRAVGQHEVEDAVGQAGVQEELGQRLGRRRRVLGRLPHRRVAAQQRGDEVPGRHRDREVAGGDDRGHADRVAEGEQLLVGHLRRHGLAVEPPALADEEVAGVDDLLDLAERLGVGLADLARDQAREGLLVVLHQPPELLDRAPAHGRRARRPTRAAPRAPPRRRRRRCRRRPAGRRRRSREVSAGLVEVSWPPGASVAGRPAMIEADGAGHGAQPSARRVRSPPGRGSRRVADSGRPATGATPPRSCPSCSPASCSRPRPPRPPRRA